MIKSRYTYQTLYNKVFILLALMFLITTASCNIFRKSESEKVEMSQERERLKADAELRARQKAHYKMQPRDTKKMMKKSKRKAKRLNRSKITL